MQLREFINTQLYAGPGAAAALVPNPASARRRQSNAGARPSAGCVPKNDKVLGAQRAQYPLIKEYTVNHTRIPINFDLRYSYPVIKAYWALWV